MQKSSLKALYLFLTSWLGIILLLMLHRALFVIYDLLGLFFPEIRFFHADRFLLQSIDFFTLLLALFFGGWYGIWLGLHWFDIVYEREGSRANKVLHGFLPHHLRSRTKHSSTAKPAQVKPKTVKVELSSAKSQSVASFGDLVKKVKSSEGRNSSWGFDDLISATPKLRPEPEAELSSESEIEKPKKTVKKKVVRKKKTAADEDNGKTAPKKKATAKKTTKKRTVSKKTKSAETEL